MLGTIALLGFACILIVIGAFIVAIDRDRPKPKGME